MKLKRMNSEVEEKVSFKKNENIIGINGYGVLSDKAAGKILETNKKTLESENLALAVELLKRVSVGLIRSSMRSQIDTKDYKTIINYHKKIRSYNELCKRLHRNTYYPCSPIPGPVMKQIDDWEEYMKVSGLFGPGRRSSVRKKHQIRIIIALYYAIFQTTPKSTTSDDNLGDGDTVKFIRTYFLAIKDLLSNENIEIYRRWGSLNSSSLRKYISELLSEQEESETSVENTSREEAFKDYRNKPYKYYAKTYRNALNSGDFSPFPDYEI